MEDLQLSIKNFALNLGADIVGFCCLDGADDLPINDLKYAVSIAVKLPDAILKTITDRPTAHYFHEYRTANTILDGIVFKLSRFIEKLGYQAFPIGASQSLPGKDNYRAIFPHKTAARLSGLGFIGKNALFISNEFGSKVRLATLLTDMPLKPELPIVESKCKNCNICVKACPAGAISGENYFEGASRESMFSAEKCSHMLKQFNDVGRGAVCGICIKVCPFNKLT